MDGDCLTVKFSRKQQNHFGGLKNDIEKKEQLQGMSLNQFGNPKDEVENPKALSYPSKDPLDKIDEHKIKKKNSFQR